MKIRLIVAVLFVIGSIFVYHAQQSTTMLAHLAESVRAAGLSAVVSVEGTEYAVENGSLRATGEERADTSAVLETVLELALTERDPLLDITGTDTETLKEAINDLSRVAEELAVVQQTKRDAALIAHLYPLDFLSYLVELETSRREFLDARSYESMRAYKKNLREAISTGKKEARDFVFSFREATRDARISEFRGISGLLDLRDGAWSDALMARFDELEKTLSARDRCTSGRVPCDVAHFAPPVPAQPARLLSEPPTQLTAEVYGLFKRSVGGESTTIVELTESVCAASLPPPYYLWVQNATTKDALRLLNDVFFIPTDRKGEVLSYMRETLDMSYTPINPFTFYVCPDSGRDVSDAYVAMYQEELPAHELALMQKNRGAGLEKVVREAAELLRADLDLKHDGVPFFLSAGEMFMTHSAFLTLFQTYNPSFGPTIAAPRESAPVPTALARYSLMRSEYDALLDDMQTYFRLKRNTQ